MLSTVGQKKPFENYGRKAIGVVAGDEPEAYAPKGYFIKGKLCSKNGSLPFVTLNIKNGSRPPFLTATILCGEYK